MGVGGWSGELGRVATHSSIELLGVHLICADYPLSSLKDGTYATDQPPATLGELMFKSKFLRADSCS